MAVAARELIGTDKAKRFWEATAQLMLWNHSSSILILPDTVSIIKYASTK